MICKEELESRMQGVDFAELRHRRISSMNDYSKDDNGRSSNVAEINEAASQNGVAGGGGFRLPQ